MSVQYWLVWALLSFVAAGASWWHYRRRELPGRGRPLLAALRAAAVALVLLLLFNPVLRAGADAGGGPAVLVMLDASLSMGLPTADGRTRWHRAVEEARATGAPVLLFGDAVRRPATLPDSAPGDPRSLLLPALRAAAEAGARRVVVVTDGGIEDAAEVGRWLPGLGLEVEWRQVGDVVANRTLVSVEAPERVQAGAPFDVSFAVAGAGEPVSVVARVGDRVVGRAGVDAAAAGRLATGRMQLRLDAPDGGGWVPLVLELEGDDAVPDDDVRNLMIHVADEPPAIALVSLRPDWEPRFLAPVLEQAVGLPVQGFLRGAGDGWIRLGAGPAAGAPASSEEVRAALRRAGLVVLHGAGDDAPAWILDGARSARSLLVFPGDDLTLLPVSAGPAVEGDFFAAADLPPSPVARMLAGAPLDGLAPLPGLRSVTPPPGAWAPLMLQRGRTGPPQPAALAGSTGGRRWVLALGTGYWQWAFRGGAERQVYTAFWGALGGWLATEPALNVEAVRPVRRVVARGEALAWRVPGREADSLALSLNPMDDGGVPLDTVAPFAGDTAYVQPPAPGRYGYRARAFSGDSVLAGEGVVVVERWSPEYARPAVDLDALGRGAAVVGNGAARAGRVPLHTTAWPWVLLVLLLAAEWILRRRWGLR